MNLTSSFLIGYDACQASVDQATCRQKISAGASSAVEGLLVSYDACKQVMGTDRCRQVFAPDVCSPVAPLIIGAVIGYLIKKIF